MQHVTSQLIDKKRELQGEINYHQSQVSILTKLIDSVEVSIKIFDPDFDSSKIKPKKFSPNKRYFANGEALVKIFDVLRIKNEFMSTHEITITLMKDKKYDITNQVIKNKIQSSILQTLIIQEKKGLVIRKKISERILHWNIA